MTCYKCGKELPEDAVSPECDPPCAPLTVDVAGHEQIGLCLSIELRLSPEAIASDRAAYEAALMSFLKMLREAVCKSGLHHFCHGKKP